MSLNRPTRSGVMVLLSAFALLGGICLEAQQARTVEFTFPGGIDRVTFDSATVKQEHLTQWIELSPILGHYNSMLVPGTIDLCDPKDPRYHCSANAEFYEWNPSLVNAQLNLDAMADRMKRLDAKNYPRELTEVVRYLHRLQSMFLWVGQQELAFLKTNDVEALGEKYDGIDPEIACANVIQRIRDTSDLKLRSHLARFDWYNCVLVPVQKDLGPYPLDDWKSFLKAHSIREEEINTEQD